MGSESVGGTPRRGNTCGGGWFLTTTIGWDLPCACMVGSRIKFSHVHGPGLTVAVHGFTHLMHVLVGLDISSIELAVCGGDNSFGFSYT